MQIIINIQGIKDNAEHICGLIAGFFGKGSSNAASLARAGVYQWFPFKMLIVKK